MMNYEAVLGKGEEEGGEMGGGAGWGVGGGGWRIWDGGVDNFY